MTIDGDVYDDKSRRMGGQPDGRMTRTDDADDNDDDDNDGNNDDDG